MDADNRKIIALGIGSFLAVVIFGLGWWQWGCPAWAQIDAAPAAVIAFGLLMLLIYGFTTFDEGQNGGPMPPSQQRFLAIYLVSTCFLVVFVIVRLLAVRFPDLSADAAVAATPEQVKASLTEGRPVILQVIPAVLPADGAAVDIQILGYNLVSPDPALNPDAPKGGAASHARAQTSGAKPENAPPPPADAGTSETAKPVAPQASAPPAKTPEADTPPPAVVVGGVTKTPTVVTQRTLVVALSREDTLPTGGSSKSISVIRNDGQTAQARIGMIEQTAEVRLFEKVYPITRETQLFLLVVFAGALGSVIHGLRSLTGFIGNQQAVASWFWFYVTRPFIGIALAVVFYATVRGGFMAGSPADVKAVSPFGVFAIAALVGMFADKAGNKLADIFDALFKSSDAAKRNNPLSNLEIKTVSLPNATVGVEYAKTHGTVEAKGGTSPYVFGLQPLPKNFEWLTIDAKTGALSGTPTIDATGKITVTVTDAATTVGTKTFDLLIEAAKRNNPLSNLEIATVSLDAGKVNTAYKATIDARGGTKPYVFELLPPLPPELQGLAVTADSGTLSCTPTTAGAFKVRLSVKDAAAAVQSRTFDLTVI